MNKPTLASMIGALALFLAAVPLHAEGPAAAKDKQEREARHEQMKKEIRLIEDKQRQEQRDLEDRHHKERKTLHDKHEQERQALRQRMSPQK